MKNYHKSNPTIWAGRKSDRQLYLHEKIQCIDLNHSFSIHQENTNFALLGYACDEGVRRNQGRIGTAKGPEAIRKMIAPLSNHFDNTIKIYDVGDITCPHGNLEETQKDTSKCVSTLLHQGLFPIVLGGGHDLAYAHYNGIKAYSPGQTIGIINLDAHFDLRTPASNGTSGTPFYQIAKENGDINYLCLGIQKESNNRELFKTAETFNVTYLENHEFEKENQTQVYDMVLNFIQKVDLIYLTIDIDGFTSSIAPGVSAPSPLGFSANIAFDTIKKICLSKKLVSVDLVEMNPTYDIDNCTARLTARLVYHIINSLS
ncbi:formimidoylglutamase [Aquimarina sp. D1M17]|uniref:formimidoylglutamase n=1 Tax=Aquimarina acroporae TaxID=2937283 RepID=UPI0020BD69CE|nr:formimidoylglutamase [Aquimarina acroporae]MCK8520622.1 formimidoylglutamase [Aquimarina acroporae]